MLADKQGVEVVPRGAMPCVREGNGSSRVSQETSWPCWESSSGGTRAHAGGFDWWSGVRCLRHVMVMDRLVEKGLVGLRSWRLLRVGPDALMMHSRGHGERLATIREAGLKGRVLYIDLDTVVAGSLDDIAGFRGSFATLSAAGMANERRASGMNSSVMAWDAGDLGALFDTHGILQDAFEVVRGRVPDAPSPCCRVVVLEASGDAVVFVDPRVLARVVPCVSVSCFVQGVIAAARGDPSRSHSTPVRSLARSPAWHAWGNLLRSSSGSCLSRVAGRHCRWCRVSGSSLSPIERSLRQDLDLTLGRSGGWGARCVEEHRRPRRVCACPSG